MSPDDIWLQFDSLCTVGWSKKLLYPPPLVPGYSYSSPYSASRSTIFIDAGIHGNEVAPIHALCECLDLFKTDPHHNWIIIPIANPKGVQNNTRYIDDNADWSNTAHSVGDMGHLLDWFEGPVLRPASNTPDNPYCEHLGKYIAELTPACIIDVCLDLHEDDYASLPVGSYLYPLGKATPHLTQSLLAAMGQPPIPHAMTRFGEEISNGQTTSPPNASFPEYIVHKFPNAIAYTVETTMNQPLTLRTQAFKQLIAWVAAE